MPDEKEVGVFANVILRGPGGEETRRLKVDTLATHTWISARIARLLKARERGTVPVETFEGGTVHRPIGELELEIDGRCATVPVVFAEEGEPEGIGRTTLAVMLLEPNLETGRLEPCYGPRGTNPPLNEKEFNAAEERWAKEPYKPPAFTLSVISGPKWAEFVLKGSRNWFDPKLLEASLLVKFHGRPPLLPGAHGGITNEGAIARVPIITFLWHLVAGCERLRSTTTRETVPIDGEYELRFARQDDWVKVSLVREAWFARTMASASIPTTELLDLCSNLSMMVVTSLSHDNPELIGNPTFLRFGRTVQELWDVVNPPREGNVAGVSS